MRVKIFFASLLLCVAAAVPVFAVEYKTVNDIGYRADYPDEYSRSRCLLDVYYPEGETQCPVIVWFHGGGLESGSKAIPEALKNKGICVVAANYRLSPQAKHPAYIEDAAAAVAWTVANIQKYGGDPRQIYIAGHSAGGYLALMVGLDKSYLAPYGVDPDWLAGFFPISGQAMTHYTIKKEMGLPMEIPYLDKYAPLAHIRKTAAPFVLIVGDAELEMSCRTAENYYLYEALKSAGNGNVKYYSLPGLGHGPVNRAGQLLILEEIMRKNRR